VDGQPPGTQLLTRRNSLTWGMAGRGSASPQPRAAQLTGVVEWSRCCFTARGDASGNHSGSLESLASSLCVTARVRPGVLARFEQVAVIAATSRLVLLQTSKVCECTARQREKQFS